MCINASYLCRCVIIEVCLCDNRILCDNGCIGVMEVNGGLCVIMEASVIMQVSAKDVSLCYNGGLRVIME